MHRIAVAPLQPCATHLLVGLDGDVKVVGDDDSDGADHDDIDVCDDSDGSGDADGVTAEVKMLH